MPWKDYEKTKTAIHNWKIRNKDRMSRVAAIRYQRIRAIQLQAKAEQIQKVRKKRKAEADKRYREKYANIIKIRKRKYYQQNRQKIIDKYLNDLRTNINMRLAQNLRNRIKQAVKKSYKAGSAVRDLGCSVEKFKLYIASKFTNEMTWDNYGKVWHLDHIIPLCRFNLQNREQFLKATHYSNYQPLLVHDNLVKNRYDVW